MLTRPALWQRILFRSINVAIILIAIDIVLFHVFPYFDNSHGLIIGVVATYILAAYLLFPLSIRLSGALTRRQRVARYTSTPDGLAIDPVNIVVIGSLHQLKQAHKIAGWHIADNKTPKTAWKMIKNFITNKPYPTAPFSSLYLFGRRQDIGFQKPIGNSPRKRHHIRYWALDSHHKLLNELTVAFWHGENKSDLNKAKVWVGAGTKDTGFGFRHTTFQITHSVDKDTISERKYIVADLSRSKFVKKVDLISPKHPVTYDGKKANSFITDGQVALVYLR